MQVRTVCCCAFIWNDNVGGPVLWRFPRYCSACTIGSEHIELCPQRKRCVSTCSSRVKPFSFRVFCIEVSSKRSFENNEWCSLRVCEYAFVRMRNHSEVLLRTYWRKVSSAWQCLEPCGEAGVSVGCLGGVLGPSGHSTTTNYCFFLNLNIYMCQQSIF